MPASSARKAARKRKFGQLTADDYAAADVPADVAGVAAAAPKRSKPSPPADADPEDQAEDAEEAAEDEADDAEEAEDDPYAFKPAKQHRFLLFVGNLPWDCTSAGLAAHFAAVRPSGIRHATQKGSDKSRGFAFVEFERYDQMEECLKRFHHSMYEEPGADGGAAAEGKEAGRRINVELTAGGGGNKSEARRERLVTKNAKLKKERKRLRVEAKKGRGKSDKAVSKLGPKKGPKNAQQQVVAERKRGAAEGIDMVGIHPSRRAQMGA